MTRDSPISAEENPRGTVDIEVDRATAMRLRRIKAKRSNEQPDCPDLTMSLFLNYLLDTEQAARDGYYGQESDTNDTN